MENTMLIQVTNQKAIGLLHELEELDLTDNEISSDGIRMIKNAMKGTVFRN